MTDEEKALDFIRKAKDIHGDKYNYDEVIYVDDRTKVKIYCNTCKDYFWQTPYSHLKGHGCKRCADRNRPTKWNTKRFIEESIKVHGDAFSYELTEWNGYNNKLKVRCTKCGAIIERWPQNHLRGQGCEECYKKRLEQEMAVPEEEFIRRSKEKFGPNKFDYSKMNYVNLSTPVTLICSIHGEFTIEPKAHLISPYGCYECGKEGRRRKNNKIDIWDEEVVSNFRSQLEEGKTYEELADYYGVSAHCIGQTAKKLGLHSIKINDKSVGERNTILALRDLSIVNLDSLNTKRIYGIIGRIKDYVVPDFIFTYNSVSYWIEYNGSQHYEYSTGFHHHSQEEFEKQLIRDENVRKYCKENNIVLIEIPYTLKSYEKIKDFLDKTILQGIDPSDLIDYKSLYKYK